MAKQSQPTISIPISIVDRIAAMGRLLASLADDLQTYRSGTLVRRKPKNVPKDQEWYWSKQWQKWERQADEELARGEFKEFDSVEELIADLHSHI
jgi:hypothetical protein